MPSSPPDLSIVIATHRRPGILKRCLEHLDAQTTADQLEVIVVSDGPDDETRNAVAEKKWCMHVRYLEIPKSHQGCARNAGAKEAAADIVLFINDDIFLAPNACDEHLLAHASLQYAGEQGVAVLGFICWDPVLRKTPVMRWLDRTGWQFGYTRIEAHREDFIREDIQHRFTYSSHISLPKSLALSHPFREDVKLYGWEDIEWGLRLKDSGVRLFYLPTAKAVHHHPMTLPQSLARMETIGESLVMLSDVNPSLDRLPQGWKRNAYVALSFLPTLRGRHAKAFLGGIRRGEAAKSLLPRSQTV